jgi:hypothetical protein
VARPSPHVAVDGDLLISHEALLPEQGYLTTMIF